MLFYKLLCMKLNLYSILLFLLPCLVDNNTCSSQCFGSKTTAQKAFKDGEGLSLEFTMESLTLAELVEITADTLDQVPVFHAKAMDAQQD